MSELPFFKTGEFAHLCDTTKETLRHYKNIKLLSPAFTDENGYQYYSFVQFSDYMLISTLQTAGCSLPEIKKYLTAPSSEELTKVLNEKLEMLQAKKKDLQKKENILNNSLNNLQYLNNVESANKCIVEKCDEEYFIETFMEEEKVFGSIKEHLEYCKDNDCYEEYQSTVRYEHDSFMNDNYDQGMFLCNKIHKKIKSQKLHIKPKGNYIKLLRKMYLSLDNTEKAYDEILTSYKEIKSFAKKNNYTIIGDLYEKELSIYSGTFDDAQYSEISVRVE